MNVFFFLFRPYGLVISFAVMAMLTVTFLETKQKGESVDDLLNISILVLIFGFLGARLYHVVHRWDFYRIYPHLIVNVWRGGLGIYGAFIGGALATYLYTKIRKLDFLQWIDIAAVGAPLGQSIGRWANYVTKELYGIPTDLPWGIYVLPSRRPEGFGEYTHFHPIFLYESLWNIGIFVVILYVKNRWKKQILKGELFSLYISLYGMGRFFLEYLRPNDMVWRFLGLPVAQLIGVGIIVCSLCISLIRRKIIVFKKI